MPFAIDTTPKYLVQGSKRYRGEFITVDGIEAGKKWGGKSIYCEKKPEITKKIATWGPDEALFGSISELKIMQNCAGFCEIMQSKKNPPLQCSISTKQDKVVLYDPKMIQNAL